MHTVLSAAGLMVFPLLKHDSATIYRPWRSRTMLIDAKKIVQCGKRPPTPVHPLYFYFIWIDCPESVVQPTFFFLSKWNFFFNNLTTRLSKYFTGVCLRVRESKKTRQIKADLVTCSAQAGWVGSKRPGVFPHGSVSLSKQIDWLSFFPVLIFFFFYLYAQCCFTLVTRRLSFLCILKSIW